MKLFAISDIHLGHPQNRPALERWPARPDDWLIVAGDVGETLAHLQLAFEVLLPRFAGLLWVPGNHDLWSVPDEPVRGEARYQQMVALCRRYGVLTPEDPYMHWTGEGGPCVLAPLFTLYDYSFRPADVPLAGAVDWARETNVVCSDEYLLHPDPYPSRVAWCHARCHFTEQRLAAVGDDLPLVLINHFPMRQDLVRLKRIPRFSLWCGTQQTADWHVRFPTLAVVYGHLHLPATDYIDGVRFEEVAFGYPNQWQRRGSPPEPREILPGPPRPYPQQAGPFWHF